MSVDNSYTLNFGPHHPATHGVLRLFLRLMGEEVLECDPVIGYLHRGIEKLAESEKFLSIPPLLDRVDYLSSLFQEHAYIMAIERVLEITPPRRAVFIRTILDELTRISSHMMALGSATYDLGCLSLFLYAIEEREKIMDIFDDISGARMHQNFYIPGGVMGDIVDDLQKKIVDFVNGLEFFYSAVGKLALENRIFQKRTSGIGVISKQIAEKFGITGPNLRASGIAYDTRKYYGIYDEIGFAPISLQDGDAYSRARLRFLEIKQSVDIILKCIKNLPEGEFCCFGYFKTETQRGSVDELFHDSFFSRGVEIPARSVVYSNVEAPRGEFGIHMFVWGDDVMVPFRLRIKGPSFCHVQLLKHLIAGVKLSDVPAIIGSLDFIISDCDR